MLPSCIIVRTECKTLCRYFIYSFILFDPGSSIETPIKVAVYIEVITIIIIFLIFLISTYIFYKDVPYA